MKHAQLLIFFIIIAILIFGIWLSNQQKVSFDQNQKSQLGAETSYPEVEELAGKNLSFADLEKYFTALAQEKSAKYAYDVLRIAALQPNTDMHLLGHVVGNVLYKEQGANGIQICTQDFRNACSHSIVVGLFNDKGEGALSKIQDACKLAPGGKGAYIMCYHGLGHGILAYKEYDLPKTIKLCQKTGSKEHNNQEYPECVSGAVMEIISGGGHDRDKWSRERPKYLKIDDPLYICSKAFMPEETRARCYDYVTPYLWESVGANLGSPNNEDFRKSFKLCDQIVEENYRNICYGGFGKEFVALVASRDIRRVDQMSNSQLSTIYNLCELANNRNGIEACIDHALSSLYWGGENDRSAAIRFCGLVSDLELQEKCFLNLINQVSFFIQDPTYRESFCKETPDELADECKERLVAEN